jgi:Uma2 family endonuclease
MTEQAQRQPFWEVMGLPPPGTPMTDHEFDQLPELQIRVELIHGVLIYPHWNEDTMTAAPIPDHQDIVGNVYALLRDHARQHGGRAVVSPVDVYLSDGNRVQPDVMWLAPDSQCARTDTDYRGAPELVAEVLSPSTATRDRTGKFDLYEQYGVLEYWIIDPRDSLVEVYTREEDAFRRLGAYKPGDVFASPLLGGKQISVRELFLV